MHNEAENPSGKSTEPSLELEFALTRTDLLWYNFHFNRHLLVIAICLIAPLAVVIHFLAVSSGDDSRLWLFWLLAGILLGIGYCIGSLLIIAAQVFYSNSASVTASLEPRTYHIDRTGLQVRSGDKQWRRTWAEIGGIRKTRRAYYLFTPGRGSIIIPLNRLSDDKEKALLADLLPWHR